MIVSRCTMARAATCSISTATEPCCLPESGAVQTYGSYSCQNATSRFTLIAFSVVLLISRVLASPIVQSLAGTVGAISGAALSLSGKEFEWPIRDIEVMRQELTDETSEAEQELEDLERLRRVIGVTAVAVVTFLLWSAVLGPIWLPAEQIVLQDGEVLVGYVVSNGDTLVVP